MISGNVSYCQYCRTLGVDDIHKQYHDFEHGKITRDDRQLFERLSLEIFQAGLSWHIVLKKRPFLNNAFDYFDIEKVAFYKDSKIQELLEDKLIIRHRLKILAIIYNAHEILKIQESFGSFFNWLEENRGKTLIEWTKLLKKNFKFVGTEIANEFLKSAGLIAGAHDEDCYIK